MGQDKIVEAMQACLRGLNEEQMTQWDMPASLWAVHRELGESGFMLVAHPVIADMTAMAPEDGINPVDILIGLVDWIEDGNKPPSLPPVFAMMFVSEAWMVAKTLEESDDEFEERTLPNRGLDKHPDRIEVRTIGAVDVAGFRYFHMVSRVPGALGDATMESAFRPGDPGPVGNVDGRLHDTLARLVELLV